MATIDAAVRKNNVRQPSSFNSTPQLPGMMNSNSLSQSNFRPIHPTFSHQTFHSQQSFSPSLSHQPSFQLQHGGGYSFHHQQPRMQTVGEKSMSPIAHPHVIMPGYSYGHSDYSNSSQSPPPPYGYHFSPSPPASHPINQSPYSQTPPTRDRQDSVSSHGLPTDRQHGWGEKETTPRTTTPRSNPHSVIPIDRQETFHSQDISGLESRDIPDDEIPLNYNSERHSRHSRLSRVLAEEEDQDYDDQDQEYEEQEGEHEHEQEEHEYEQEEHEQSYHGYPMPTHLDPSDTPRTRLSAD